MPQNNSTQEGYISLTEATKYCDYTQEYLSLRARQGKLKAVKFGRNWVTKKEWVQEYFGATNSEKAKEQTKKAQKAERFLFSADRLFSYIANLKIVVKRPEFKYAVVGVLLFIFIGAGFVWSAPKLSVAKDLFVEGLVVFSEEVNRGISKFSEGTGSLSDTMREVVKVPPVPPVPHVSISSVPINSDVAQEVKESIVIGAETIQRAFSKNFPSARGGAGTVAQSFRETKDYGIDGVKNIVFTIASIPPSVANRIFVFVDNAVHGIGYTGRILGEYTQWLNQTIIQTPSRAAAENISTTLASVSNIGESFYSKYISANNWVKNKVQKVAEIPFKISNIFSGLADLSKPKQTQPGRQEVEQQDTEQKIEDTEQKIEDAAKEFVETGDIEELQQKVKDLETKGFEQKEIIKEVKKITQIYPVKEIIKETKIIDSEALLTLAILQDRIDVIEKWEQDIKNLQSLTKKLKASPPATSAPTAPIYIGSQGIQVGGAGIFSSLGVSGSAGLSNLGVGGSTSLGSTSSDKLTVAAASNFSGPVTISSSITHTGAFTQSGGDVTFGGNVTVGGDLTVTGAQTYSGASSFTVNSTTAALLVNQQGTGNIVQFQDDGTDTFAIADGGDITIAGNVYPAADNIYDLGESATPLRWKTGYFGTSVVVGNTITIDSNTVAAGAATALNLTGNAASTWQVSGGALILKTNSQDLTIETDTSGNLVLTSAGSFTETFAAAGGYQLKRGADAVLAVDANGAIAVNARGTDQDITITPSGSGNLNFYSTSYYMNSGGDLVAGGKFTFEGAEYVSNETDGWLLFQGSGAAAPADDTDITFDLEGSYPVVYSATDSKFGLDDDLEFVGAQTISTSAGDLTLDSASKIIIKDAIIQFDSTTQTFDLLSASGATKLQITNSDVTPAYVANLDLVDGSLYTAGTERIDNAGNLVNIGDITVTGNVDGVDVAGLKTDVDGFPDELKNLAAAEINQLDDIDATTISATQWGYVGALDQGLAIASNVQFASATLAPGADAVSLTVKRGFDAGTADIFEITNVAGGTTYFKVDKDGAVTFTGPLTVGISQALSDATGTLTLSNLDAIDDTTETTLEGAIDIAGDVSGTGLGSVSVDKIKGVALGTTTATNGNILMADGTDWETVAQTSITSTGILAAGSISSGFGAIDIGTSGLTVGALNITHTSANPVLTITNQSGTDYDPSIQFRVGASPSTKFTLGVDDSATNDDFVISRGDTLGTDNVFVADGTTGYLTMGTSGDVIIGAVGSVSNLIFEESSTISGQGTNTITLGVSGDTIKLLDDVLMKLGTSDDASIEWDTAPAVDVLTITGFTKFSPSSDTTAPTGITANQTGGDVFITGRLEVDDVAYLAGGTAWTHQDIAEKMSTRPLSEQELSDAGVQKITIEKTAAELLVEKKEEEEMAEKFWADEEFLAEQEDIIINYEYPTEYLSLPEPSDVVVADTAGEAEVIKSFTANNRNIMGIISTNPAGVLGGDKVGVVVGLTGTVPTKVCDENGVIQKGDKLTTSSIPGIAMKATDYRAGIVGIAMENWSPDDTREVEVDGQTITVPKKKIKILLTVSNPVGASSLSVVLNENGEIVPTNGSVDTGLAINEYGVLEVEKLKTKELCLGETCITEEILKKLLEKCGDEDCPAAPVCESFFYSEWGECQPDNTQTRTVMTSLPERCEGGNSAPLAQSCGYVPDSDTPSAPVCDADNIDLCDTQEKCEGAALYLYNDVCNIEAEIPVDVCGADHLDLCDTQELCETAGLYWHDEVCNTQEEVIICVPEWSCSGWLPLPETIACGEIFSQTQTCSDSNNCGSDEGKPAEEQTAVGTNASCCGIISCDASLYLVGDDCENTCVDGTCQDCVPVCACETGYQKDEDDLCQPIPTE